MSAKYKPYPTYKDSGVEWLGEVPAGWEAIPLKRLSSCNDDVLPESTDPETEIEYVDISSVSSVTGVEKTESMRFEAAPSRARRKVQAGDVIISTVRTYLKAIAPITAESEHVVVSTGFAVIRPKNGFKPSFARYALHANYFMDQVVADSVGVSYPAINASELTAIKVAAPSPSEQTAIATFLNRETVKLDTLITKQEKLIELLQEKRQALISHAVTKGLNPDAPMKDSGVEWLGEVPAHWEIHRIKWVARMESGHTPDKKVEAYWSNADIPWVSLNDTGQLKDVDYISDTAHQINQHGIANSSARLLPSGVVVFSRDATIGRCAITTRPMAVSQHFIAWVCSDEIVPEFLLRVLRSMSQELERLTFGATVKTIGMPDVKTLVTTVPPRQEQERIVNYIRTQTAKLDTLIEKSRRSIDLMREHRTALISAAVTGKIDVREAA